jgi:hypothetical protein
LPQRRLSEEELVRRFVMLNAIASKMIEIKHKSLMRVTVETN